MDDFGLILLQSTAPAARIGPLVLSVRFPGYKPTDFDVYATPLDKNFVGETFLLEPLAESFGSIQLKAHALPDGVLRADPDQFAGTLYLIDERVARSNISISFSDLQTGVLLEGIPSGDYEVRFEGRRSFFGFPAGGDSLNLRVGEDSALLELDFSKAASVELELLDSEGWPELELAGFLPSRRDASDDGGRRGWTTRGTVTTRWSSSGERPVILVAPGTYRFEPLESVVGLQPIADARPGGGLKPPVILQVKAGDSIELVWQKLASVEH